MLEGRLGRRTLIIGAIAAGFAPRTQAQPARPTLAPAQMALADQFDLASSITGRTYRIYVSRPGAPPPSSGYEVVYALDADGSFPIVARQLRRAPQVLVIGIAYPDSAASSRLRMRDLTPSQPNDAAYANFNGGQIPNDFGGAEGFHRFMVEELRPQIARLYPVNREHHSLMGYSLGGLFALHVMFTQPNAYQRLFIGSPSIWWNGGEVLKDEAGFAAAVRAGKAAPRILITSAQWEQGDGDPSLPRSGPARERRLASKMVDNARDLASRLKALGGAAGYEVNYSVFAEERHDTGIPAAFSRGANFLYPLQVSA